eukprot:899134-Pyramimonas_sp.AAC.1
MGHSAGGGRGKGALGETEEGEEDGREAPTSAALGRHRRRRRRGKRRTMMTMRRRDSSGNIDNTFLPLCPHKQ